VWLSILRVVKESSDALNPPVVTTAFVEPDPHRGRRTPRDYVALAVATCGVGFLPVAPGTWGSLVGVFIYLGARSVSLSLFDAAGATGWERPPLEAFRTTIILVILIGLTIAGIWAASRTEALLARKDPGAVVIDEVIGQLITFVFVPARAGWWAVMAGFVAFRVFDIWKPYPVRRLEALESGLGIMADDVLAGLYAATVMSLVTSVYMLF
jgi:phosphatidylglycerophosphatase A